MAGDRTVRKYFWGNQTEEENMKTTAKVVRQQCERFEVDGCQQMEEENGRQICVGCHSEGGTGYTIRTVRH
jgi:hypothetical protein